MNRIRTQIQLDYDGRCDSDEDLFQALECPVGDLFDDDTYWLDEEETHES